MNHKQKHDTAEEGSILEAELVGNGLLGHAFALKALETYVSYSK